MKNIYKIMSLLLVAVMGLSLAACSKDDLSTNQYGSGVRLNVYGPQPVMRGGQLRFLGSNLDQIAQVIIPGCDPITSIEVVQSGVPSEIRVAVPKDGPEEGPVTLVTKTDDKIVTKTSLTYIEGIEFESFSSESVMPGETLTITGDYLNLVHMIAFAEEVYVSEKDFVAHSRYEIQVIVPEEARTGKVGLYDTDLTVPDDQSADVSYNIIETDQVLNVGTPVIAKFASPRGEAEVAATVVAKMDEQISVTGDYFNLIAGLKFGSEDDVFKFDDFEVSEDGKTITFILPEEAPDGDFSMVCRSGVIIPVGLIETVAPSNCVAAPAPVKAGASLTVTGTDLDVVSAVEMPNVTDEIAFTKADDGTKVVITAVPETAQEGNLVLRMKNGKGTEVPFTLVKPVVTAYNPSPVAAGGVLTIVGTDLDLVASVDIDGTVIEIGEDNFTDAGALEVTVPATANSCEPVLNLKNMLTVTAPALEITKPEACYITAIVTAEEDRMGGELFLVEVANEDKLTGVQVNGTAVQYILNGQKLYISIPAAAGPGSVVKLISSNGEVDNVIDFQSALIIENVLWSGAQDLGSWSINWEVRPNDMFVTSGAEVGDKVRIYGTPTADYWQVQLFDGHWNGLTELGATYNNGNNVNAEIEPLENGYIEFTITADMLDAFTTFIDWGYAFIIQGESFIVSKITLYQDHSKVTLWSGEQDLGTWSINWEVKPNDMFVTAGVKAGQKLRIYGYNTADTWQVQLFDGHWAGLTSMGETFGNGNNVNNGICDLSAGYIEINITAEMATLFTTAIDWGYAFIIQGENFVVTKLELAN